MGYGELRGPLKLFMVLRLIEYGYMVSIRIGFFVLEWKDIGTSFLKEECTLYVFDYLLTNLDLLGILDVGDLDSITIAWITNYNLLMAGIR